MYIKLQEELARAENMSQVKSQRRVLSRKEERKEELCLLKLEL